MNQAPSSLIIDVRPGELLRLEGEQQVSIELMQKSGRLARLRICAPKEVKIQKEDGDRSQSE